MWFYFNTSQVGTLPDSSIFNNYVLSVYEWYLYRSQVHSLMNFSKETAV